MPLPLSPAQNVTQKFEEALSLLEAIVADRTMLAELDPELRRRFLTAAGQVAKPDKESRRTLTRAFRLRDKRERRQTDSDQLATAGIRKLRENPIFKTPMREMGAEPQAPIGELLEERGCYVCQARYTQVHHFYDQMCIECGDFNYAKRSQTADLHGRVALVTGARVKIGYQAAIMLLRAGAHVICVTRFPVDAAERYSRESDFSEWADRLEIHGVDLRHTPSVEALCSQLLATHSRLDFLVNNACQTVRRPPGFYEHLMRKELSAPTQQHLQALLAPRPAKDAQLVSPSLPDAPLPSAELTQVRLLDEDHFEPTALFPKGQLDADLQQVDLRKMNSWRMQMHQVPTIELLEVHLVNAVAPFVLNARLKPLMMAVPTADKHIVNVSAMEGQFYRTFKSDKHPHTNMAKASLNMMTRTAALDYIKSGIHMNAVDTGWVTDEDPIALAERKRELHGFHPPLDIVDGAARIIDPIFDGINTGAHVWGQFLKDYKITDW